MIGRRRGGLRGLVTVGALVVCAALILAGCGGAAGRSREAGGSASPGRTSPGAGSMVLLWPRPKDPAAAVERAGLPMYSEEKVQVHYHAHLDVFVKGRHVVVPGGIGITQSGISPLHTHDSTGVIHIEAPKPRPFTLGQVFTEWGVPFGPDRLGQFHASAGRPLRVYVGGERVNGDPTDVHLRSHQEIVVAYGRAPSPVPSAYDFPPGL